MATKTPKTPKPPRTSEGLQAPSGALPAFSEAADRAAAACAALRDAQAARKLAEAEAACASECESHAQTMNAAAAVCILCRGKGWTLDESATGQGCPACTPTERPPPPPPSTPAEAKTLPLFAPPSLLARFEDAMGWVAAEVHAHTDGRFRVRVFDTDAGREVTAGTMLLMGSKAEAVKYAKRCAK